MKRMSKRQRPESFLIQAFWIVAERTGLEPATPCVTGRYSNRLNYRSAVFPWERGAYYGLPLNSSTLFLTF